MHTRLRRFYLFQREGISYPADSHKHGKQRRKGHKLCKYQQMSSYKLTLAQKDSKQTEAKQKISTSCRLALCARQARTEPQWSCVWQRVIYDSMKCPGALSVGLITRKNSGSNARGSAVAAAVAKLTEIGKERDCAINCT